jgi:threonine/homoserine/homoserine lactone efflux protein
MVVALLVGIVFGFFGAMPLAGPVALVVFSRGMEGRFRAGMFTALGASAAEFFYALMAFWGFATFLAQIPWVLPASKLAAAVVLTFLGIAFVRKTADEDVQARPEGRKRQALALGFFLTALNPTLIATWSAATTTLYSSELVQFDPNHAWPFAVGVFCGDMLWYWLMLLLTRRGRGRFRPRALTLLLRTMGLCLLGLAAWFAVAFVRLLLSL